MSNSRHSNTSFLCSLLLHVGVLLILSALFMNARGLKPIFLEADVLSSENPETEISVAIEIPTSVEFVNLDATEIETPLDDMLETGEIEFTDSSPTSLVEKLQLVALNEEVGGSPVSAARYWSRILRH